MRKATLEKGDNGINHFSAMSVSSDNVIVEYTPGNDLNTTLGTPVIDYYHFGIENQMGADDIGTNSTCGAMERKDVQCWAQSHPEEFEAKPPGRAVSYWWTQLMYRLACRFRQPYVYKQSLR